MSLETRKMAIEKLQAVRDGRIVIAYVTSCRQGAEGQMGIDAIPFIYEHLRELPDSRDQTRIDLFIHSNGGDGVVPWRLVTLLREFCVELNVLVPHRAFSAATLTALGADSIVMHPMGTLGPTDPSILGPYNPQNPQNPQTNLAVSVEDVASYISLVKDDVGIKSEDALVKAFIALTEKVHPLALGNVKRTTSQGRMLGDKLLRRRSDQLPAGEINEIMKKLGSELFSHGHPINAKEAREDLGLSFVEEATSDVSEAMWNLYSEFDEDLKQSEEFNPLREAIRIHPLTPPLITGPPGIPPVPTQTLVSLDPLYFAMIESSNRADAFRSVMELFIQRDYLGNYQSGQVQVLEQGWTRRR